MRETKDSDDELYEHKFTCFSFYHRPAGNTFTHGKGVQMPRHVRLVFGARVLASIAVDTVGGRSSGPAVRWCLFCEGDFIQRMFARGRESKTYDFSSLDFPYSWSNAMEKSPSCVARIPTIRS